ITGWSFCGKANQFKGTTPALQESVPTARPTWVPLLAPNWAKPERSPTITSGPGTVPANTPEGGITEEVASPLTTCVISIGRMLAVIEIVPTSVPAADGPPSKVAKSFE